MRAHQRRDHRALILRTVTEIDRARFEQAETAFAMVGAALDRAREVAENARTHLVEFACYGIRHCQGIISAAEQRGICLRHEAPGDGFQKAARRETTRLPPSGVGKDSVGKAS